MLIAGSSFTLVIIFKEKVFGQFEMIYTGEIRVCLKIENQINLPKRKQTLSLEQYIQELIADFK